MEELIRKHQEYLLNPHLAVKDDYSFFDGIHHILKLEKESKVSIFHREIYELFHATFKFFLEPKETYVHCYQIPLLEGEEDFDNKKLIHTEYLNHNGSHIKKRNNSVTEREWYDLIDKFQKNRETPLNWILERETISYYWSDSIGRDLWQNLKTDHGYLLKGFSFQSKEPLDRSYLLQAYQKSVADKVGDVIGLGTNKHPKDISLQEICNTYNQIRFGFKQEQSFEEYRNKMTEYFSSSQHYEPINTELSEDEDQIVKLYNELVLERFIDNATDMDSFKVAFGNKDITCVDKPIKWLKTISSLRELFVLFKEKKLEKEDGSPIHLTNAEYRLLGKIFVRRNNEKITVYKAKKGEFSKDCKLIEKIVSSIR